MLRWPVRMPADARIEAPPVVSPVEPREHVENFPLTLMAPGVNANLTTAPLVPKRNGYIRYVAPLDPVSGTTAHGNMYAVLKHQRADVTASVDVIGTLWSGYMVSGTGELPPSSWPNVRINETDSIVGTLWQGSTAAGDQRFNIGISPRPGPSSYLWHERATDGRGVLRQISPANPAAGARATITVPAGVIWNVHGAMCNFAAAAVAGNRHPDCGIGNGQAWLVGASDDPITSGVSAEIFFARDYGFANVSGSTYTQRTGPFPGDSIAVAGDIVFVGADNMNAADQITAPSFRVEEWATP